MPNTEEYVKHGRLCHDASQAPLRMCGRAANATPSIVFGEEVVGRKVKIFRSRTSTQRVWEEAALVDFNAASGKHKVQFADRPDADWVSLGHNIKFKWLGEPSPTASPNPTYLGSPLACGLSAIGCKVRVYWPAMGKWYTGVIKSYDAATDKHRIDYKDGDSHEHQLRNEAVTWLDDGHQHSAAMPPSNAHVGTAAASRMLSMDAVDNSKSHCSAAAVGSDGGNDMEPAEDASNGSSFETAPPSLQQQQQQHAESDLRHATSTLAAGQQLNAIHTHCISLTKPITAAASHDGVSAGHGLSIKTKAGASQGGKSTTNKRASQADGDGVTAVKRQRKPSGMASELRALAVGTRIGIYWDGDATYYRGKLTGYSNTSGKYEIRYDDGEYEWLCLDKEQFCWYTPRGLSAGYRPALHEVMVQLGANNVPPTAGNDPPSFATPWPTDQVGTEPERPQDAVGRRVSVYWQADGQWYPGEVLSFNARTGRHHVLYNDGEDEWLELAKERVAWAKPCRTGGSSSVGLVQGGSIPHGRSAVGWRVAVYWKDDMTFYEGRISSYDTVTGRHEVRYDDGESETISLHGEKIIWRLPAGVGDPDSSAPAHNGSSRAQRSTARGRGHRKRSALSDEEEDEEELPPSSSSEDDCMDELSEEPSDDTVSDSDDDFATPAYPCKSNHGNAHGKSAAASGGKGKLNGTASAKLGTETSSLTAPDNIAAWSGSQRSTLLLPRPYSTGPGTSAFANAIVPDSPSLPAISLARSVPARGPELSGASYLRGAPVPGDKQLQEAALHSKGPAGLGDMCAATGRSKEAAKPSSDQGAGGMGSGARNGTMQQSVPSNARLDIFVTPGFDVDEDGQPTAMQLQQQQLLTSLNQRMQVLQAMSARIHAVEVALGWQRAGEYRHHAAQQQQQQQQGAAVSAPALNSPPSATVSLPAQGPPAGAAPEAQSTGAASCQEQQQQGVSAGAEASEPELAAIIRIRTEKVQEGNKECTAAAPEADAQQQQGAATASRPKLSWATASPSPAADAAKADAAARHDDQDVLMMEVEAGVPQELAGEGGTPDSSMELNGGGMDPSGKAVVELGLMELSPRDGGSLQEDMLLPTPQAGMVAPRLGSDSLPPNVPATSVKTGLVAV